MRRHQCPVCAYDKMAEPPKSWYICPCCGTEFENDDDQMSHSDLRARWVASGVPWFSSAIKPPKGWNGYQQLVDAGFWDQFISSQGSERQMPQVETQHPEATWSGPDLQNWVGIFSHHSNA